VEYISLCGMPPSSLNYMRIVFRYRESKEPSWKEEQDGIYKHRGRIVMCSLSLVQIFLKK